MLERLQSKWAPKMKGGKRVDNCVKMSHGGAYTVVKRKNLTKIKTVNYQVLILK